MTRLGGKLGDKRIEGLSGVNRVFTSSAEPT